MSSMINSIRLLDSNASHLVQLLFHLPTITTVRSFGLMQAMDSQHMASNSRVNLPRQMKSMPLLHPLLVNYLFKKDCLVKLKDPFIP